MKRIHVRTNFIQCVHNITAHRSVVWTYTMEFSGENSLEWTEIGQLGRIFWTPKVSFGPRFALLGKGA